MPMAITPAPVGAWEVGKENSMEEIGMEAAVAACLIKNISDSLWYAAK